MMGETTEKLRAILRLASEILDQLGTASPIEDGQALSLPHLPPASEVDLSHPDWVSRKELPQELGWNSIRNVDRLLEAGGDSFAHKLGGRWYIYVPAAKEYLAQRPRR